MLSENEDYQAELVKVVTPTVIEITVNDEILTINIDGIDHESIYENNATAAAMAWIQAKLCNGFMVNVRQEGDTLHAIIVCLEDEITVNQQMLDIGFDAVTTQLPEFY